MLIHHIPTIFFVRNVPSLSPLNTPLTEMPDLGTGRLLPGLPIEMLTFGLEFQGGGQLKWKFLINNVTLR